MDNFNENRRHVDVLINGKTYHYYDEKKISADELFWYETKLKWIEFIEQYNFDIYTIKTKPKLNLKIYKDQKSNFSWIFQNYNIHLLTWLEYHKKDGISFNDYLKNEKKDSNYSFYKEISSLTEKDFIENEWIFNLKTESVKKIKTLQSDDLNYLYRNMLFEILYVVPKIDSQSNYYYELVLIINKQTDINKIVKHNFNLVEIYSFLKLNLNDVSFNLISSLFPLTESQFYDTSFDLNDYCWNAVEETFEEKKILYNNPNLKWDEKQKLNYIIWNKTAQLLDHNKYNKILFKQFCFHIYSFGGYYSKTFDNYGVFYNHEDKYKMNFEFVTNYFQIMGAVSADYDKITDKAIIKPENICFNTMSLSYDVLKINERALFKEYVLNGFIDFSKIKINNE